MKVLIVFPTIRGGGAEHTVITICNYLIEQKGYTVDYFVFDSSNFYADILSKKSKLTNANIQYGVSSYLDKANTFFRAGLKLKSYLQINKYDLVVSGVEQEAEWAIAFANRFLDFKAISIIHTEPRYWNIRKSPTREVFLSLLNKMRMSIFEGIIAISSIIAESLKEGGGQKIVTIPPAIDSKKIKSFAADKNTVIKTELPYILNPARLNYQKNQSLLLRAFLQVVEQVSFNLVFLGTDVTKLQSYIANSHLIGTRLHFLEQVTNPYPLINDAAAVILTSRYEGLPLVFSEAAVLNTPVISSRYTGYNRLFSSDYEYLFDSENETDLCAILLRFNEDLLKNQIKPNPIDYKDFEVDNCANRYNSFFEQVLND